jgi:hypothetical protein
MPDPRSKKLLIALAIFGAGLLLSAGICGVGASLHGRVSESFLVAGLIVLAISVIGIGITCVALVIKALAITVRR